MAETVTMVDFLKKLYLPQLLFLLYTVFFYLWYGGLRKTGLSGSADPVWLIGENGGECLQDNGYWLYRFCRKTYPRQKIFFIIRKRSINVPDWLRNDANLLYYGSPSHAAQFIQARVCFFATAHRDIAFPSIVTLFRKNCFKVFLQHGIMGFKKTNWWYNRSRNPMDMFCVSSQLEKEIIENHFDFASSVPRITGLARFDSLRSIDLSATRPSILYIPTWRDWQLDRIEQSRFAQAVSSLLNNSKLLRFLEDTDIILTFYAHKNMRKVLDHFRDNTDNNRIWIIRPGDVTVQQLLINSSLMITDYSSVCWDFFYLKKPVVFYQFDQQEYLDKKGSYLDLKKDCFGEVFTEEEPLIAALEQYHSSGFRERSRYQKMRSRYFAFADHNNCQRIVDAVREMTAMNRKK